MCQVLTDGVSTAQVTLSKTSCLIESGDWALVTADRQIYLKGRHDRVAKVNAKLVDLLALENVSYIHLALEYCGPCFVLLFNHFTLTTTTTKTTQLIKKAFDWVENAHAVSVDANYLALFVIVSTIEASDAPTAENTQRQHELVVVKIRTELPSHYEPRKVVVLTNGYDPLPMNKHGKSIVITNHEQYIYMKMKLFSLSCFDSSRQD